MLRRLCDFGRQRTAGQAIGFYLFYLLVGSIAIWVSDALVGRAAAPWDAAPLSVTRPTEGSTTVSDEHTSIVASADGTTTVTVGHGTGSESTVTIAADGSTRTTSPYGNSSFVSGPATVQCSYSLISTCGTRSTTVDGTTVVTSADGSTSVRTSAHGFGSLRGLVWSILAVLFSATLSLLVWRGKRRPGRLGYLGSALLSMVAALVGGLVLGLVFAAYLTTRPERSSGDAVASLTGANDA